MQTSSTHAIDIQHLDKSFGDIHAIRDLSFHVRQGELFAFLGVNGAGKSTTISILCGLLAKDGGTVTVCGQDADRHMGSISRRLGIVFQNSVLDSALSVRDNLRCRAALYGITGTAFRERLAELSALLDLDPLLAHPVGKLSGGQRRRIDVARALFHSPDILILDEPTRGIDVGAKYEIYCIIADLAKQGKSIIMISSEMSEIIGMSNRVMVMCDGRITGFIDGKDATQENIMALATQFETAPDAAAANQ